MIRLVNVSARGASSRGRPPSSLRNVSIAREGGVLAVVGAPADGTSLLLDVVAGLARARSGQVLVDGKDPDEVRAAIAHVPLDPALPEALRVDEVCALASTLRGEQVVRAAERLAPLGLEALASRRVRSLSTQESRAVALSIALTSRARVLLVEEPLAHLDPSAPSRVAELLRARVAAGATAIVTTASVRDATRLADDFAVLTAGILSPAPPALAHVGREGAQLRVVVAAGGASSFVSALTGDPAIASLEVTAFASKTASAVLAAGPDLLAVSAAVARASARSQVDVEAIELGVLPLAAIRAALAAPAPAQAAPPPVPAAPAPSTPPPSAPPAPPAPPPSAPPSPPEVP